MSVSLSFLSVGCNREPECLDWHHGLNLIAFGAGSLVAIYDPEQCKIIMTLKGTHEGV